MSVPQQLSLLVTEEDNKKRTQGGETTSNLTVSAYVADNAEVFPQILSLHVPTGATVADVTYSKGVFWRHVPIDSYTLLATDIATGTD